MSTMVRSRQHSRSSRLDDVPTECLLSTYLTLLAAYGKVLASPDPEDTDEGHETDLITFPQFLEAKGHTELARFVEYCASFPPGALRHSGTPALQRMKSQLRRLYG